MKLQLILRGMMMVVMASPVYAQGLCGYLSGGSEHMGNCSYNESATQTTISSLAEQNTIDWKDGFYIPQGETLSLEFASQSGGSVLNNFAGDARIEGNIYAPNGHVILNTPEGSLYLQGDSINARSITAVVGATSGLDRLLSGEQMITDINTQGGYKLVIGKKEQGQSPGVISALDGNVVLVGGDIVSGQASIHSEKGNVAVVAANKVEFNGSEGAAVIPHRKVNLNGKEVRVTEADYGSYVQGNGVLLAASGGIQIEAGRTISADGVISASDGYISLRVSEQQEDSVIEGDVRIEETNGYGAFRGGEEITIKGREKVSVEQDGVDDRGTLPTTVGVVLPLERDERKARRKAPIVKKKSGSINSTEGSTFAKASKVSKPAKNLAYVYSSVMGQKIVGVVDKER